MNVETGVRAPQQTAPCPRCKGRGRDPEFPAVCNLCHGRCYLPIASRVPITHHADPPTSALAEREITDSGIRDAQSRDCYRAVCWWPGLTASEYAREWADKMPHAQAMDRYVFGRRLPEIAEAVDGATPRAVVLIERGPVRACKVTGRPCVTWWKLGTVPKAEAGAA